MIFTLDERNAVEIKMPENNIVIPNSITALPVSTSELGYVIGFLLFSNIDDETRKIVEGRILSDNNLKSILVAILEVPQNKKLFKALYESLIEDSSSKDKFGDTVEPQVSFETMPEPVTEEEIELFFFNRGGANACGYPVTDKVSGSTRFVVMAGSKLKPELTLSSHTIAAAEGIRNILDKEGVVKNLTFVKDYTFHTPSAAALAVCGRSSNGWQEWKNKSGIPLDKVRKKVESRFKSEDKTPSVSAGAVWGKSSNGQQEWPGNVEDSLNQLLKTSEPQFESDDEVTMIEDILDDLMETEFDISVLDDLFFYNENGAKATAHISVDRPKSSIRITVHKGARIAGRISTIGKSQRERLIQDGVLVNGMFSVDYTFDTPIEASAVLSATKDNVYLMWKNQDGVSLEDVRRYLLNDESELN